MIFTIRHLRNVCLLGMFIASTFFTCHIYAAEPAVRITEIMYNAEGRDDEKEFVEVINVGREAVDMTTVQFFERADRQNGRTITQGRGDTTLQPGEIAIIVAKPESFLQNYSFDGTVLDTTNFALLNAGASVSLKIGNTLLHSISYTMQDGASGDGNSLHIDQNNAITAATPNPGVVQGITIDTTENNTTETTEETNTQTSVQTDAQTNTQTDTSTQQTESEEQDGADTATETRPQTDAETPDQGDEVPEETTIITNPAIIFSASTTEFSAVRQKGEKKETLYGLWNFGDGDYTYGDTVKHAYLHPGTYITVFQELGEDGSEGIALQEEIQVLFPQISIERINDAFIRLHNQHPFILDVSDWRIESQNTIFTFPPKSLVPAQNSTVIPFTVPAGQDIFFITAGGGQFSGRRADPITEKKQEMSSSTNQKTKEEKKHIAADTEQDTHTEEKDVNEEQQRQAESIREEKESFVVSGEEPRMNIRMIIIWIALLIGIITIALVPLIFVRHEKEKRLNHR